MNTHNCILGLCLICIDWAILWADNSAHQMAIKLSDYEYDQSTHTSIHKYYAHGKPHGACRYLLQLCNHAFTQPRPQEHSSLSMMYAKMREGLRDKATCVRCAMHCSYTNVYLGIYGLSGTNAMDKK